MGFNSGFKGLKYNCEVLLSNQSVKHKHIYLYLSMTRHVSVYTDHHQATIAKLSKQGRIQHNYIHNMGSHMSDSGYYNVKLHGAI